MSELPSSNPATFGLRRRQLLRGSLLLSAGWVALKAGRAWVLESPVPRAGGGGLRNLSPAEAGLLTLTSEHLVGTSVAEAGDNWQPARHADGLLSGLTSGEVGLIRTGLMLFEHGSLRVTPFSAQDRTAQLAQLASWRSHSLPLKRGIWGFLHAVAATSYAASSAGWRLMGYPGPCRADQGFPGRIPGQTARFDWDSRVP